jgi:N-acetylmuramoyl-L-alanine amidase
MANRIKFMVVHWSVTGRKTTLADIDRMHKQRGYKRIGYHYLVLHPGSDDFKAGHDGRPGTLVRRGRPLNDDPYIAADEVAAAAIGFNRNSVHICVVGNPSLPLHPLQVEALTRLIQSVGVKYQLDVKQALRGHRDLNPTECPGDAIYRVLSGLRQ